MVKIPNYVENNLKITGDKDELKKFKAFAKGKEFWHNEINIFNFEKFIPYPQEFRDKDIEKQDFEKEMLGYAQKQGVKSFYELTIEQKEEYYKIKPEHKDVKDGFNSGGYEWCCLAGWGTKWNSCEAVLSESDKNLIYDFDTAWSPPIPVIAKASELFPKLKFVLRFWEGGNGFQGKYVWKNNVLLEQTDKEYSGNRGDKNERNDL